MERGVEFFVAVNCMVIGISHLFQAGGWVEFFKILRGHGRAGAFANGFLSLTFGSIVVSFHWVWEGVIPIIVTCLGIAQVIKSLVAFTLPNVSLKSMSRPAAENVLSYQVGGVLFLVLSGAIFYHLLA